MAHVIFDGDIRRHPDLRSLFWQWGVTVGGMSEGVQVLGETTVENCDAVVHLCGETSPWSSDSGAMPDGAEEEGVAASAQAPLLVIGAGPVVGPPGIPWVTIPDPGPGGSRLRAALQSCQDRSRMLRGESNYRHDLDQFRNFLGHELRTPLTAINTALSVLAAEGDLEPGSAKMLAIAKRNLARLTGTVDWSQEMLFLAEAPPAAGLGPVSLASLAESLPNDLDIHLAEENGSFEVLTDSRLLGMLAVQMERALGFACPESRPAFRLDLDPDTGECRLSATIVTDLPKAPESRVSRTGGVKAGLAPADWNRAELDHLVRMLISPHLLQVLGVGPRFTAPQPGTVELYLCLPRWAGKYSPLTDSHLYV